ncbi:hypothetical protein VKT23_008150 [Stygiomarasmius scandens]|uniref:Late endosomal/lysosomal adaptor and MAPK and MTOR activator 5 n=1 Tax=Marasmiellus scandens TaxID=2682957 RepID=A0ABR1JMS1_9AGAR
MLAMLNSREALRNDAAVGIISDSEMGFQSSSAEPCDRAERLEHGINPTLQSNHKIVLTPLRGQPIIVKKDVATTTV